MNEDQKIDLLAFLIAPLFITVPLSLLCGASVWRSYIWGLIILCSLRILAELV